ncbi:MAG: signal peptidase II [Ignavibacteria bacterium]|nr:signal peptidase II [Ignavibacteria bacterium]MBT8381926.1 signal peptidase II [Ignavibacteria bacterium]MBT8390507.1 signal peptidase II [Ignavibacteria bacterium]NNL21133.1 signal peptidase II [Ignavibacteriaceae bacterium]
MKMLILTFGIIVIDQITKLYVKGISIPFLNIEFVGMFLGESFSVIGNFFRITFTENPGMAFGFDPGSDFKLWISLFSLFASIGLLIYLYVVRDKSISLRLAIALILGGAVGNLIDRMFYGLLFDYAPLFYGKVVDFFDFDFFNFTILGRSYERWPIFNIADASVTVGVLILLFFYKHSKDPEKVDSNQSSEIEAAAEGENLGSTQSNNDDADLNNKKDSLSNDQNNKGKTISV